ncbi:unnamed protein product, partial [Staurois parvus]
MGMWGGSHTHYTRVYLISCWGQCTEMYRHTCLSTFYYKGQRSHQWSTIQARPSTLPHWRTKYWGCTANTGGVGVTDILLDVRTAGNHLHISDDGKTASRSSSHQNRPETPERFQDPQVMSSQSFSSGRHLLGRGCR